MSLVPQRLVRIPSVDARLLEKAAIDGRIKGVALNIWKRLLDEMEHASSILRTELRAARMLHSRERRFVADSLFALLRIHGWLTPALGSDNPEDLWLAWLVRCGLPTGSALAQAGHLEQPLRYVEEAWYAPAPFANVLGGRSWLSEQLVSIYGESGAGAFLEASAARATVDLRIPVQKLSVAQALERLSQHGLSAKPTPLSPYGIRLEGRPDQRRIAKILGAPVLIQDEGSQLVAHLVRSTGSESVLDYCAGAGGKSLALAALPSPPAQQVATDVRGRALAELSRRRKGWTKRRIRTVRLNEDGEPTQPLGGPFDWVLVDAPCMGTGTWRRHPELIWRTDDPAPMLSLQADVLRRAAELVKPGGALVYATCSVLPAENEAQVEAFLAQSPRFRLEPIKARKAVPEAALSNGMLRVAPHTHGTDGFFGAVLRG